MFLRQLRASLQAYGHVGTKNYKLSLQPLVQHRSPRFQARTYSSTPPLQFPRRGRDAEVQDDGKLRRPRTVLHLSGLPNDISFLDVRNAFAKYGAIKSVMLNKDIGGPFKAADDQAYIEFHLADDAMAAFEAATYNGITVAGSTIKVSFHKSSLDTMEPSTTIHITGLPCGVNTSELLELLEKYAAVEDIRPGRYAGTAFVDFRSTESALGVMEAHKAQPLRLSEHSKALHLQFAAPTMGFRKSAKSLEKPEELQPPHRKVFATRFATIITEERLRGAFEQFGKIRDITINYYTDRTSRNVAFIEYETVEEACRAIDAWQGGRLAALGEELRMDFYRPPEEHPPHYTLRIEGYTGGERVTERIASLFKPFLWQIHYPPGAARRGKGSTVAFLEFATIEHATAALRRLRKLKVNGHEAVVASYAPKPKGWRSVGGAYGRDHGGEKFAFGLPGSQAARLDEESRLFRDVQRREQWSRLERIAKYLGREWLPGNRSQMQGLVSELAKRRLEGKSFAGANDTVTAAESAPGASSHTLAEQPVNHNS